MARELPTQARGRFLWNFIHKMSKWNFISIYKINRKLHGRMSCNILMSSEQLGETVVLNDKAVYLWLIHSSKILHYFAGAMFNTFPGLIQIGKLFCNERFNQRFAICKQKPNLLPFFTPTERAMSIYVVDLDKYWHMKCFRCAVCNKMFDSPETQMATKITADILHCEHCFLSEDGGKLRKGRRHVYHE